MPKKEEKKSKKKTSPTKTSSKTNHKYTNKPSSKISRKSAAPKSANKASSKQNVSISIPEKTKTNEKLSNRRLILDALIIANFVFSVTAFGLSIYNFANRHGSLYSNFDGNSQDFTQGSIAEVAEKVSPSVVSILTETRTNNYWISQSSTSTAAGTGLIVTSDGYVLTNKHVVESAKTIQVVLDNGTTYSDVTLVGTDPLNDVAFIKINNVSNLTPATLGDSKTLNIGQEVIAIGNALGLYQNSVTEGIISGTGRTITALDSSNSYYEQLTDMIQTDASINAGNSGGPLVNAAGQVVGINTAVSAAGNGIGFAIPINSVKGALKTLIETGQVKRAYIGVQYVSVTPDIASEYQLSVKNGAYLPDSTSVISGSPAEKAGLKTGDIITKVNGVEIGKYGSLSTLIGEYSVGDTIELTYIRDGNEYVTTLTLAEYTSPTNTQTIKR